MRKILAATGQSAPESKAALEVNVGHPLLKRLDATMAEDEFAELAWYPRSGQARRIGLGGQPR